jgi:hypothetical protein
MAQRIMDMRGLLRHNLEQLGSPHNWQHITDQVRPVTGGTSSRGGGHVCNHTMVSVAPLCMLWVSTTCMPYGLAVY